MIKIQNLQKTFRVGKQDVPVLKDISVEVQNEDFAVIVGPSGCGKSTLLHIILGLEQPTAGSVEVAGKPLYVNTSDNELAEFRKVNIGMIYQQSNWVKSLTVIENVSFPLWLKGVSMSIAAIQAMELLKKVEMDDWADYNPTELSSGQQQRVALARALINDPQIIIADEPTGNLDYESGQKMMELLQKLNVEGKKTVVMVTHDLEYLHFAKVAIKMFDGEVEGVFRGAEKEKFANNYKSKRFVSEEVHNKPVETV